MSRLIYTLIFTLLMPVILVRLFVRARKAPAYGKNWWQRFGVFNGPKKINGKQGGIWFHTVSVGEFIAAAPLIEQTMHAFPDELITITTTTPTGSEQVRQRFSQYIGKQVFHVYLPYDLPWFLYGFLYKVQPRLLVILETELWPNLIHCAHKIGCYTMLVNARLSEKSAKGYGKVSGLTSSMLNKLDVLAVQNKTDGQRFLGLGMKEERMLVTGSIKFDLTISSDLVAQGKAIRQSWGETRPVVIVASTHHGEDVIALDAYSQLKKTHPQLLMILVPRHPERFDGVADLIEQQKFMLARRSLHNTSSEIDVFLLDSMGELMPFLAASDVCVMGGSFVENGGHNPLEPAALSIPVLMGKSQVNFALICQQLEQAGGLKTVSAEGLVDQLDIWFKQPEIAQAAGHAAQQVVAQNRGAKQKVFELIEEKIKKA
ncbi:lipid IV(A) 3-deoxy-D-manno-octulosonic acid transferase [Oceaniserpentilla sp. 4NH20-0058]|uniref:lipid IV(A) 3-deoxy-D-manno-octulosonic acid transferase n=1 Tax=Oceaniserpentilla sp. 4NH20-0058 TaxID=3127660 RepID=UPI00310418E8